MTNTKLPVSAREILLRRERALHAAIGALIHSDADPALVDALYELRAEVNAQIEVLK